MTTAVLLDVDVLRTAIQDEYAEVAACPMKGFHFHTGRFLASRLGYPAARVDALPGAVVESFAGVGNPFSWGDLNPGETVVDLGTGAGFDALLAASMVGPNGRVIGVDMTRAMLDKARHNAAVLGLGNVGFREAYLEDLPLPDASADVVISNGVINLSAEKSRVFAEAHRVLKPGGRLSLSDIVSEAQMPASIKDDADLWAACIGGAEQVDDYTTTVEAPGFDVAELRENEAYAFTSERARGACNRYGVKSVSLGARKRGEGGR